MGHLAAAAAQNRGKKPDKKKPLIVLAVLVAVVPAIWITQNNKSSESAITGDHMEAGKKFLEENAKKAGVKTTPSGLQYEVLTEGTGPKPAATSTVEVHYEGRLLNGFIFDSSYKRKESISFPLNRVIPGWTEGLQLMPTGSKYRLYIPSELAYGARGAGADIPPNSALIFDVELIAIR
jgi:FKBP-type peptidyl-prolyl cis-trans isomerase FkpA